MRKLLLGFFRASTRKEIEAHARGTYDDFFARVRKAVPRERLMKYELGTGWEPLCEFLGKEVPDLPFPRANERKAHSEGTLGLA